MSVQNGAVTSRFRNCMWVTCKYLGHMPMIQIRNVPEALHRRLKARAAMAGLSLSDLLLREVMIVAETPSVEELRARLAALPPVTTDISAAEAVRAERDGR